MTLLSSKLQKLLAPTISKKLAKRFQQGLFLYFLLFILSGGPLILSNEPVAANGNGTGLDRPCDSNIVIDDGANTDKPGHVRCLQIIGAGGGDQIYNSYALQSRGTNVNGDQDWLGHYETFNNIIPNKLDSAPLTTADQCDLGGSFNTAQPSDHRDGMKDTNGNTCFTPQQNSNIAGTLAQASTPDLPYLRCAGLNVLMHDASRKVNDGLTERLVYCGTELSSMCLSGSNLRGQGLFNGGGGLTNRGDPFDSNGLNAIQLFCMGNNASSAFPGLIDLPTYNWCHSNYVIVDPGDQSKNYCNFNFDSNSTSSVPVQGPTSQPGNITFQQIINPITNPDFMSLTGIVKFVTRLTFAFITTVAGGVLFYAGFIWMTAQGEPDKIKKAQSMILYAFVGIAVIAFSVIIIRLTALVLGFNINNYV